MSNFRNKAVSATTLSKLMENRTKISNDELMSKYPDGVTVTGFDWMKGDDGKYPVCVFLENENECFFGGTAMTSICDAWMDGFGSPEECSEALAKEGGVKLKFIKDKTKNNRAFTKVEVI